MKYYIGNMSYGQNDIFHDGSKGMQWGVRRYRNYDGTLTEEGKLRYRKNQSSDGAHAKKNPKWGIRRYQNYDGTLTDEGKQRFLKEKTLSPTDFMSQDTERLQRLGVERARKIVKKMVPLMTEDDEGNKRFNMSAVKLSSKEQKVYDELKAKADAANDRATEIMNTSVQEITDQRTKTALRKVFNNLAYGGSYGIRSDARRRTFENNEQFKSAREENIRAHRDLYAFEKRAHGMAMDRTMRDVLKDIPDDLKDDAWVYMRELFDF